MAAICISTPFSFSQVAGYDYMNDNSQEGPPTNLRGKTIRIEGGLIFLPNFALISLCTIQHAIIKRMETY